MSNVKVNVVQKLTKHVGGKIRKLQSPTKIIPDIEECASSTYFSPIQTRRQRISKKQIVDVPTSSKGSTTTTNNDVVHDTKKIRIKSLKTTKGDSSNTWEPENWRQLLQNIREMRQRSDAPVDSMGCHKCADSDADEKTQRFHKLVALMLSSQTKDETTFAAMQKLQHNKCTPKTIVAMNTSHLEELLRPVSFYKNKAKYLQQTSQILIDKYESDIPNNIKELIALPGVGPKMAHICMATAWHEITGIGVDVHVHRISNRLQWVKNPTKEPEQTRIALEHWLPRDLWNEINYLLVGFGQTICTPTKPHCDECLNSDICPASTTLAKQKRTPPTNNSQIQKLKFQKKKLHL